MIKHVFSPHFVVFNLPWLDIYNGWKRPSVCTGAEWSILVLGFAKYSKRSNKTKVSYTLKNIMECSSQGAFKMVGRSKWLLFRPVAPPRSITLLIWGKLQVSEMTKNRHNSLNIVNNCPIFNPKPQLESS